MRDEIAQMMRDLFDGEEITRRDAAQRLNTSVENLDFLLAFGEALNAVKSEGEFTMVSLHRGGRYVKRCGEIGFDAAMRQVNRKVRAARNKMRRAHEQVMAAPLMTSDDTKRRAAERKADRTEEQLARLTALRAMKKG